MSQQPKPAATSAASHSPLNALPDNVLLIMVQLLPLAGKRALRITCRSMCSFVDVHGLHTLQLAADAALALTPLPKVSDVPAVAWRGVQRRNYHHITCLSFIGCKERWAQYFARCVSPSLQHLQEVRVAGSARTVKQVLKALLDVHSSAATGASCLSGDAASASGMTGSSSSAVSAMTAAGGTESELVTSYSNQSPSANSVHTIRCKLISMDGKLTNMRYLFPVLVSFSGLRSLHISGTAMYPTEAAAYSCLSALHALSSLSANVPPQILAVLPGLQRLHVSRRLWDTYTPLGSLTALRSLTLPHTPAAQRQQLAVCLPPTLTEFKMLGRLGIPETEQGLMEAWQLRSLARLDVPALVVSCEVLSGLSSLTMLSCYSLDARLGQFESYLQAGIRALADATCRLVYGVHAPMADPTEDAADLQHQQFLAAPLRPVHSLRELRLHDSGISTQALPEKCPALTHLSIHASREGVHTAPDVRKYASIAEKMFGRGDLPQLQYLDLPVHLLSHQAVGAACSSVTSLSCVNTYWSSAFVVRAWLNITAMEQLQQLRIHCLSKPAYDAVKGAAGYAGDKLLQAAASCSRLTELDFHGAGVSCSEDGLVSLAAAPALRVLKLHEVDASACTMRALGLIADIHSLRYLEVVECLDESAAQKLVACVKKSTLELVVTACKPCQDTEDDDDDAGDEDDDADDDFDETDHEDVDSPEGSDEWW